MKILLIILAALVSYLVGGVNPAIILSRRRYRLDLRRFGSHNAGFTNFLRVLGERHAWQVLVWDAVKSAVVCAVCGVVFHLTLGRFQLGAAIAMFFAMLGHSYPVWYGFHGGKSAAVMGAGVFFISLPAGALAIAFFGVLLTAVRIMSLSALAAAVMFALLLGLVWTPPMDVMLLCLASVALLFFRHRENIARLLHGKESRLPSRAEKKARRAAAESAEAGEAEPAGDGE